MNRPRSNRLPPVIFTPWLLPIIFLFLGLGIILFRQSTTTPRINELITSSTNSATTTKKVLVLNFDPIIESAGGKRLHVFKNWSDPQILETDFAATINEVSHGLVTYQIVERQDIDAYPPKKSGFAYTDAKYLQCLNNHNLCNNDGINYQLVLSQYHVCDKLNSGEIDELWLWGGPWFGYMEAAMAGPGAFFTNGVPITNTTCTHKLNVMGFNYERSIDSMFESFGHRAEGIMTHVYKGWAINENNPWNKYTLYNAIKPGRSGCGRIHFTPNSLEDYQYTSTAKVSSMCLTLDDLYPLNTGYYNTINCREWGCSPIGYYKWWFSHLPHTPGSLNNIRNNWWSYIVDYDRAIRQTRTGTQYFSIQSSAADSNTSCKVLSTNREIYLGLDLDCSPKTSLKAILNFTRVSIPPHAQITNAHLAFVQDGPYTNPLNLKIYLQSGAYKTNAISWSIKDRWEFNTINTTPDFTSLLQSIIDKDTWKSGNSLSLIIVNNNSTSYRKIYAYDRDPTTAPKLVVEYTLTPAAAEIAATEDAASFDNEDTSPNPETNIDSSL